MVKGVRSEKKDTNIHAKGSTPKQWRPDQSHLVLHALNQSAAFFRLRPTGLTHPAGGYQMLVLQLHGFEARTQTRSDF